MAGASGVGLDVGSLVTLTARVAPGLGIRRDVVEDRVRAGSSLVEALRERGSLPRSVLEAVAVGEMTGTTAETLDREAALLEERARDGFAATVALIGWLAWAGVAVAIFGIVFETIGDAQLERFKADPTKAGKVLDTGLWRYTRHPNYFGDACAWWGIYLVAAETGLPGALTIVGPILLTFLLTRVSGVPTTEGSMRRKRPDYEAYVARTSSFIPMPPKRGS